MKDMFKARKSGFTLVELLIVTVIIGILAGMMMLTMGSATDSAEAAKLINDLRLVKSASLLYYADQEKWPDNGAASGGTFKASETLLPYMDKALAPIYDDEVSHYTVQTTIGGNVVEKIIYGISPENPPSQKVMARLAKNGAVLTNTGAAVVGTAAGVADAYYYMAVH